MKGGSRNFTPFQENIQLKHIWWVNRKKIFHRNFFFLSLQRVGPYIQQLESDHPEYPIFECPYSTIPLSLIHIAAIQTLPGTKKYHIQYPLGWYNNFLFNPVLEHPKCSKLHAAIKDSALDHFIRVHMLVSETP